MLCLILTKEGEMELNVITALIGGLGIGTLLNSLFNAYNDKQKQRMSRQYEEKKHSYFGLLDALHKAAVKPSNETSKEFALWQTRCSLFGSKDVVNFAQKIVDTNDDRIERDKAFNGLLEAMRKDLSEY